MAGPAFKALGTHTGGTSTVNIPWPTQVAGDFGLLLLESCGGEAIPATPSGWTVVANSPQATGAGTAGTQLTAFYRFATTATESAAAVGDPGDHVNGLIVTFTEVAMTGNPWDVTAGGVKAAASTSASAPSVTTTVVDTLVVNVITHDGDLSGAQFSAAANASLGSVTEQFDNSNASGNGGGICVITGTKATAGATGTTTATVTSSINAMLTIALRSATSADLRLTNLYAEALTANASADVRLTSLYAEALTANASADVRLTSLYVEVLQDVVAAPVTDGGRATLVSP